MVTARGDPPVVAAARRTHRAEHDILYIPHYHGLTLQHYDIYLYQDTTL